MGARMQVCPERIAVMIEELGSRMTPTGTVVGDGASGDGSGGREKSPDSTRTSDPRGVRVVFPVLGSKCKEL